MTNCKYDPYSGLVRISEAREKLSFEAAEVVTLHLALEREIDDALSKVLPRNNKITNLGFQNKAAILHSVWQDANVDVEKLYTVLIAFNDLRNKFAHGNSKAIETCRTNLFTTYKLIDPSAIEPIDYLKVAQGICAYLGQGMMPDALEGFMKELDHLVNVALPKALGVRK